jgi:hypothetical protein
VSITGEHTALFTESDWCNSVQFFGGAAAIKYWIYITDKSGEGLLSAGPSDPFQNFSMVASSTDGLRMLDYRKPIVEVSNEDFQNTTAGEFQATIALQVTTV